MGLQGRGQMLPSEAERPQTPSAGSGVDACQGSRAHCPLLGPPSVPVARISPGLGGASGRCIRQAELGAPPVLPPSQTLRKRDPGPQSPSKMEGVHSLPRATRIKCHELGGLKGQEFTLMGVEAEDFKGWWPGCTPSTGPGGEAVLASPASTAPSCP